MDKTKFFFWPILLCSLSTLFPCKLEAGNLSYNVNSDSSYGSATYSDGSYSATCDSNGNCSESGGMPSYQQVQQTMQAVQTGVQMVGMVNEIQQISELGHAQTQQFQQAQQQLNQQAESMDQNYSEELKSEKEAEQLSLKEEREHGTAEQHNEIMNMIQGDTPPLKNPYSFNEYQSYHAPIYEEAPPPTLPAEIPAPIGADLNPSSSLDFKSSSQAKDAVQGSSGKEISGGNCFFGICGSNAQIVEEGSSGEWQPVTDTRVVDLRPDRPPVPVPKSSVQVSSSSVKEPISQPLPKSQPAMLSSVIGAGDFFKSIHDLLDQWTKSPNKPLGLKEAIAQASNRYGCDVIERKKELAVKNASLPPDRQENFKHACNFFVMKIGKAMDIPYFRRFRDSWLDKATEARLTNEIYKFIEKAVKDRNSGWVQLTPEQAQASANKLQFVVAVQKNPAGSGHIGMVTPTTLSKDEKQPGDWPWIRDAQNSDESKKGNHRFSGLNGTQPKDFKTKEELQEQKNLIFAVWAPQHKVDELLGSGQQKFMGTVNRASPLQQAFASYPSQPAPQYEGPVTPPASGPMEFKAGEAAQATSHAAAQDGSGKEISGGNCFFGVCSNPANVALNDQGDPDASNFFRGADSDPNVVDLRDKKDLTVNLQSMKGQTFLAGRPEPIRLIKDREQSQPLAQAQASSYPSSPYIENSDALWEKFQEDKKWALEKVVDWAKEAAISNIMERSNFLSKVYEPYQEMNDLYEKLGGVHEDTINGLFEGRIQEAARELASPYASSHAEEMMEEFTRSRAEAYRETAHEIIQDKIQGKIDEALEEKEDGEEEKSNVVPLLGLKSADRQRQEYLNRHR